MKWQLLPRPLSLGLFSVWIPIQEKEKGGGEEGRGDGHDNRAVIFSAQRTEFPMFKRNFRPHLNLGISQCYTGVGASVKPLLKLCCYPATHPGDRKAKYTPGGVLGVLSSAAFPELTATASPRAEGLEKPEQLRVSVQRLCLGKCSCTSLVLRDYFRLVEQCFC